MLRRLAAAAASLALLAACQGGDAPPAQTVQAGAETPPVPAPVPVAEPEPEPASDRARPNPVRNAYFGDVHVHTGNSFDAYVFNVRSTPDDAYRFAKGETIQHGAGYEIALSRPLDFLAVTDHGEYLGVTAAMNDPDHPLSQTATARAAFGEDAVDPAATFQRIGLSFVVGDPIADINEQGVMNKTWADTVEAAERHYEPGDFTTFAGYEFTAMRVIDQDAGSAANIHRNVIFRDKAPDQLFTTLNSTNPEALWSWMDAQRAAGLDSLAIPHNSNASNGEMFSKLGYAGGPLTEAMAQRRARNEPLVEITQIKGTSDTHPTLSPNDEWADFEHYEYYIGSNVKSTVGEGDYVRTALARGLAIEDSIGVNPFAFGLVGASDTHIAAGSFDEKNHWGKFPQDGAGPEGRGSVPPDGADTWDGAPEPEHRVLTGAQFSASGLAAVWAEENTREAIFDAMRRRETFGTSGPRIKVRFFAGERFNEDILASADPLRLAYATGAPMGSDVAAPDTLGFLAWAVRDPQSAPLQRLQIIKVWSEDGELKEEVHDAACAGGRPVDPETRRCPVPGSSVDLETCETTGEGAGELKAFWRDPGYDPAQDAAYYVRVLETPTCRWSTWDAVREGKPRNPDLPATLQERAWSSPIWVKAEL